MIRIVKPVQAPQILRQRGEDETNRLCEMFESASAEFRSGTKLFDFDGTLYGAVSVKKALRKAQHDKCAFCESKIAHIAYGDVEHFRPKAGVVQQDGDTLERPGYYWLAYEWTNLLFCCQLCNQRFKRNLFPLRDPGKRARSHQDTITGEEPLLIDPSAVDPATHIGWKGEYPEAMPGSAEGETTIEMLGLRREELAEQRRDHLRNLLLILDIRRLLRQRHQEGSLRTDEQTNLVRVEALVRELTRDSARFAAMSRSAAASDNAG
jgi:uncharacterized protein (TIGR02646 family)